MEIDKDLDLKINEAFDSLYEIKEVKVSNTNYELKQALKVSI